VSSDRGDVPERVSDHRRIAVLGGVYANAEALAAVLADARGRDAEAVFALGDLGGFGPHPDRVVPLLRDHDVRVVRGNYDEAVAAGAGDCKCGYTDPRDNHYARISYAYTVARTPAPDRAWLAMLPAQRRVRLGAHRVLMCHGSPRRINEFLWESTTPDGLLRRLLADYAADVLLCTHTGLKWHRPLDGGAAPAVNVGAVGRPENDGTPRVWYALLTAAPDVEVQFVPVAYDHESVARAIEAEGLPPEFAETLRTGWWTTCLENLPSRERLRGRF
jgi:diadenosine tetraphosphatase ApaH/serine/threonine PP2A family protein phosphatase